MYQWRISISNTFIKISEIKDKKFLWFLIAAKSLKCTFIKGPRLPASSDFVTNETPGTSKIIQWDIRIRGFWTISDGSFKYWLHIKLSWLGDMNLKNVLIYEYTYFQGEPIHLRLISLGDDCRISCLRDIITKPHKLKLACSMQKWSF